MTQMAAPFDRALIRARRSRAALRMPDAAFLHEDVATRLLERLTDINRSYDKALALGWDAASHPLPAALSFYADPADRRVKAMPGPGFSCEEDMLPIREHSMDLVISNLALHWVNDLPGALIQVNHALRPDGLFMAAMLGGDTLVELRNVLLEAESDITGGAGPRVSPMATLSDVAGLLQRAGFAMPVADQETITVSYSHPLEMMHDLRAMGETNATTGRQKTMTRRDVMMRAAELYAERYSDEEGRVSARFQVLFLTGWAPGPNQPRPKMPGSATVRLADALGSSEVHIKGTQPSP